MFKKVDLGFFEVWVGQICSLECIHCCHLIPYVQNRFYDVDALIADTEKILKYCNIDFYSVVGGEPFCNRNIYKLFDYIRDNDKIKDGKVVTNGTVMPDSVTLESIKKLNGKLEIRIDMYPGTEERVKKFYQCMLDNGIRCHISEYLKDKKSNWKMVGGPVQEKIDSDMAEYCFEDCFVRHCYTLADGELTTCPRGVTSESVYGVKKNKYEHIRVKDLKKGVFGRAMIATCFFEGCHKDYCEYCLSLSKANPYFVEAGEQLNEEIKKKIKCF
jgi:hypothetical protein